MEKTRLLDRGRWVVALVVLSGFGPYLLSVGLRLEHVVIYGLSAIALANILRCRTSPVSAPVAAGVLLPLAVAALWGGARRLVVVASRESGAGHGVPG